MDSIYKRFSVEGGEYLFCSDDFEIFEIGNDADSLDTIKAIKIEKSKSKINTNPPNQIGVSKDNKISIVGVDLTNGCNLNCTYCFIAAYQKPMKKLSLEKFTAVLDFLEKDKDHAIHFYFAGAGEPTINFKLLQQIPSICKERGFNNCDFELTTNGTLLNQEIIEFLKSNNFKLVLSMDGSEELHNKTRVYRGGKGSFNDVYQNLQLLQENNVDFVCNTVILPTHEFLLELFSFFEQHKIQFVFNIATDSVSGHYAPKIEELKIFEQQLSALMEEYRQLIENNKKIYAVKLLSDLKRIHYRDINKIGCVASKEGFHIDIEGNIFTCSYHSGSKDIAVGNIYNGVDYDKIVDNNWYAKPVDNYKTCKKCWMKYLCAGSCFAIKWLVNNNTDTPYRYLCKMYDIYWKQIIKLYIQVQKHITDESNVNYIN